MTDAQPSLRTRPAGTVDRVTFRDAALQARFERDGFVVVPLLDDEQVRRARERFASLGGPVRNGFQTDFEVADPDRKREVHEFARALLGPRLEELLDDHRLFMSTFLAKWPETGSNLYLHQDWSYVDERIYRSVVAWVALEDISPERRNGALQVLPGSHRVAGEHRGTRTTAWYVHHVDAVSGSLVDVTAPAGHAVIMDNALVHASPDNETGDVRLAMATACIPAEAALIHAVARPDGQVDVLQVDDRFFQEVTPLQLREQPPTAWTAPGAPSAPAWAPADEELAERLCGRRLDDPGASDPLGPSAPPTAEGSALARAATTVLALNHAALTPAGAPEQPFLPLTGDLAWVTGLESAWTTIRDEYLAAQLEGSEAISLAALAGAELPNVGRWEAVLLRDNAGWIDDATRRHPQTTELLRAVPGIRAAMFSTLGPWARIDPHRGANKGVLRAHLGIVVPDPPGQATLWAGAEHRRWEAGRAFVFDDTFEHRVANQSPQSRVSLMIEFDRTAAGWRRWANRTVQAGFRLHPQVRGASARRRAIDRAMRA